jgi:hypothetical protein
LAAASSCPTTPAALALFLTERKGSCLATWSGRLSATEQRALFGQFLGKGTIEIDGAAETLVHWVSVCFGQDYDVTFSRKWGAL